MYETNPTTPKKVISFVWSSDVVYLFIMSHKNDRTTWKGSSCHIPTFFAACVDLLHGEVILFTNSMLSQKKANLVY